MDLHLCPPSLRWYPHSLRQYGSALVFHRCLRVKWTCGRASLQFMPLFAWALRLDAAGTQRWLPASFSANWPRPFYRGAHASNCSGRTLLRLASHIKAHTATQSSFIAQAVVLRLGCPLCAELLTFARGGRSCRVRFPLFGWKKRRRAGFFLYFLDFSPPLYHLPTLCYLSLD
jgi:hypothetical protein